MFETIVKKLKMPMITLILIILFVLTIIIGENKIIPDILGVVFIAVLIGIWVGCLLCSIDTTESFKRIDDTYKRIENKTLKEILQSEEIDSLENLKLYQLRYISNRVDKENQEL